MAKNVNELLNKLPVERRRRVEKRVQAEHQRLALEDLRKARKLTQVHLAGKLDIDQGAVSKIERRTDMYLSTLRGYIEAMGGRLELRAIFPDEEVGVELVKR